MQQHILFVDDDAFLLESIQCFWKQQQRQEPRLGNIEVHTAANSTDAFALALHYPMALVVSDEDMGQNTLPGHQLLKHLQRLSPHTKRALLTGFGRYQELKSLALERGVDAVLSKPLPPMELLQQVLGLLGKRL